VPSRWVTPGLVDEVLAESGEAAAGRRFRALPGRLGVYLVLGLCLFSDRSCRDVLEDLTAGLGRALGAAGWQVPASTALTGLRRRLGARPFELLFWRLAGPLGTGTAPWSHVGGLLAVAWDGTTVKAPASQANIAAFGRPGGKKKDGHYPQMRLVTLIACGTRALLGAATGPLRGCGERALAGELTGQLRRGMLLLADRGFYSYQLWNAAAGTGADLLWRVTAAMHLPAVRALPDGSWLTHVNDPAEVTRRARRNGARRRRGSKLDPDTGPLPGITVRVIEFWLTVATQDGGTRTERYRLITTLLDHCAHPAGQLAAGYAWRWAAEMVFTQLAKRAVRPVGRDREDVADLDVAVGDDDAVDEQLGQLPPLGEAGGGEAGPDGLAECLDTVGDGAELQPLAGGGVQLPLLGGQGGVAPVQVFSLALEFGQPDDLGQVGVEQSLLLAVQLVQGLADGRLAGLELLREPGAAMGPVERPGDLGGIGQQRAQVGPGQVIELPGGNVAGGAALSLRHPQPVGAAAAQVVAVAGRGLADHARQPAYAAAD